MSNKDDFSARSNRNKCESPEHDIATAKLLVSLGFRLVGIIELEDGRYDFRFDYPLPGKVKATSEEAAKQIEAEIERLKNPSLNFPEKKLKT